MVLDGMSLASRYKSVRMFYRRLPFSKKMWIGEQSEVGVEVHLFLNKEGDTWTRLDPVVFAGALYSGCSVVNDGSIVVSFDMVSPGISSVIIVEEGGRLAWKPVQIN